MAIGPLVRSWLGPLERPVAEMYRAFFFDLGQFVRWVRRAAPARRILEVGCGEGAVCERLARAYPRAAILGIDLTPRVGRLFRGADPRVAFRRQAVEVLAGEQPGGFDLVVLADVLHHVPWEGHAGLLRAAARALRPGGRLVVKDWERRANLAYPLAWFADYYVANDRGVRFKTAGQFRSLLRALFGRGAIEQEARFAPWANNVAFLVRPGGG